MAHAIYIMKKILLFKLVMLFMLASCHRPSGQEEAIPSSLTSDCYAWGQNNSKILMHLEVEDDTVTGKLWYDFYEKDDNIGELKGKMHGDTLFALYTFRSEGVESQREVAFLAKDSRWIEGYGSLQETNGIARFEAPGQLDFSQGTVLSKINCQTDARGCLVSFGYRWSSIRQTCIIPAQDGIRLNAMDTAQNADTPAFVLFSENQDQAELFLPAQDSSWVLQRKGKEGAHAWTNSSYKLFPWKGYVLQYEGKTIYAGM